MRGSICEVMDMSALEEKLGYTFKNKQMLADALYHSSYANEHRSLGIQSNERLEFLGDAVLGLVSADFLYREHPDLPEGDLTRIRAALVCEESLHEVAQNLELGQSLKLGRGEESGGGRTRTSILADATEAVFAAVYLDGGMEEARALIHRVLLDKEREEAVEERRRDYKTALQELIQRRNGRELRYVLTDEMGPDHAKTFVVSVLLDGENVGEGSGRSKKEAEQSAARAA
jgi:ribonuclease-3